MIWCRPPPGWDKPNKGTSHLRSPLIFLCLKTEKEEIADGQKAKDSR